jgi:hypothetical protein
MLRYVALVILLAILEVQAALIQTVTSASALQRALRSPRSALKMGAAHGTSCGCAACSNAHAAGCQCAACTGHGGGCACGACAQKPHRTGCNCATCGLATWRM